MAVTGSIHPETVIPVALYKLVKTRSAVGLTEAEIVLPAGCEMGSYKTLDLPIEFATWQTMSKVQLFMFEPVMFKQWNAIWTQ